MFCPQPRSEKRTCFDTNRFILPDQNADQIRFAVAEGRRPGQAVCLRPLGGHGRATCRVCVERHSERGIALAGNTCPVVDRFAQPHVRSEAHGDDVRLSAAFGNWCGTRQCPEPLIVTAAERPRTFGEQCSEVDPADTGYRFENHDVLPLKVRILTEAVQAF